MWSLYFCAVLAVASADLPANYETLTAVKKQDILWKNINADAYTPETLATNYPTGKNKDVYTDPRVADPKFLSNVFTTFSDEMEPGKPKLISPFGVAFKGELVIKKNSKFTGIFQTGGMGIIRLSANLGKNPTAVAMGVKILIDGKPSQNILAQYDSSEVNTNVVSDHFSQAPSTASTPVAETALDKKVVDACTNVTFMLPGDDPKNRPINNAILGLVEQSRVENTGKEVTGKIVAPYILHFVPSGKVTAAFNRAKDDFRKVLLKKIKADIHLFTVKAQAAPECDELTTIGEVWSRSEAVASFYEDQRLLFRASRRQWDESFASTDTCSAKKSKKEKHDEPAVTPAPLKWAPGEENPEDSRNILVRKC